jgi:hypothetical protein
MYLIKSNKKLLVKIVDAVDLVVEVDGEGDAVEAVVAHAATEATGVVKVAHRLQNLSGTIFLYRSFL